MGPLTRAVRDVTETQRGENDGVRLDRLEEISPDNLRSCVAPFHREAVALMPERERKVERRLAHG
jgi:hypothetical protein